MHPFVAHKWACLVLLWGLSTTLARPLEDDNLFALAPDGGNTFTSDIFPVDGGSESDPLFIDEFNQNFGDLDLGNDPLLGYDPSTGSGFDVAYAVGDCKYGEVVQNAGSVAFSSAGCPDDHINKGCGRSGSTFVIGFDDRLPGYCGPQNQKCCSSAAIDGLTDCQAAPQPANALSGVTDYLNGIGNNVGDAWSRAFNSNPGGSLSPSGGNFNLLEFFGIGGEKKKKRSNDFCAAPGYS